MKYKKPPLGIEDQIQLLSKRGMEIPDSQRTARYLSHISYFRLRGYWISETLPLTMDGFGIVE